MIEELIEEIKKAEDEAERIVKSAIDESANISFEAMNEAERLKKSAAEDIKQAVKEVYAAAEKAGDEAAKERIALAQAEADSIVKKAEKNIARTAEELSDAFIKTLK